MILARIIAENTTIGKGGIYDSSKTHDKVDIKIDGQLNMLCSASLLLHVGIHILIQSLNAVLQHGDLQGWERRRRRGKEEEEEGSFLQHGAQAWVLLHWPPCKLPQSRERLETSKKSQGWSALEGTRTNSDNDTNKWR